MNRFSGEFSLKTLNRFLLTTVCTTSLCLAHSAPAQTSGAPVLAQASNVPEQVFVEAPLIGDVDLGALGARDIKDVPYSITVLPQTILDDVQATSFEETIQYLPSVQLLGFGGGITGRPESRGFESSVFANTRVDGMNAPISAYQMEEFQRLEVLNGLSGSLYGAANPSGTFNFVQKRPTDTPLYQAEATYRGIGTIQLDGDFSRPFADGLVNARATLQYQNGENFVTGSNMYRDLEVLAIDVHPLANYVLETNFSHADEKQTGWPGLFNYVQNSLGQATIQIPAAPDPAKQGYGQSFVTNEVVTDMLTSRLNGQIGDDWSFVIGGLYQASDRWPEQLTNTFTSSSGNYKSTLGVPMYSTLTTLSDIGYVNGRADLLGIANDIVVGTNGWTGSYYAPYSPPNITLGSASLANPVIYANPNPTYDKSIYLGMRQFEQSLIFGDTITFTPQWQLMATASEDWIDARNFSKTTRAVTTHYSDSGISPDVSLIFKPWELTTVYASWGDSLQQGDFAPAGTTNAGQGLAPYRSEQWEAGVKERWDGLDLSGDLFRITRPFAGVNPSDNTFEIIGQQENDGLELTASGEVVPNLSVFGGLTLIDGELSGTGNPSTNNKEIVGVPKAQANLLFEYRVPMLSDLVLNANFHYTGRRAGDDANTTFLAGYGTVDVGMRFVVKFGDVPATIRAGVTNITDTHYWASVIPSDITGSPSSSFAYQLFLGTPREYYIALQGNF